MMLLKNLTSIVDLNIGSNGITNMDFSMQMNHLQTLSLYDNQISSLTFDVNKFPHLRIINLSQSKTDLFSKLSKNRRIFKQNNAAVFYRSVYLKIKDEFITDCFQILHFIKLNIHLNLYTHQQISHFFSYCISINLAI